MACLTLQFSLYFYEVLSKQTTPIEMKGLLAKNTEDYVARYSHSPLKDHPLRMAMIIQKCFSVFYHLITITSKECLYHLFTF